jgi:Nucleotidyltransferase domain
MLTQEQLTILADRLVQVPGIVGVMLGGSRARDDFAPDSDYDLGLYYRPPFDVDALGQLAIDVPGPDARVTSSATGARGWTAVAGSRSMVSLSTGSTPT